MNWLALHLPALALEVYSRALPPDRAPAPAAGRRSYPPLAGADARAALAADGPDTAVTADLPASAQPQPLAVSEHDRIIACNAAAARLGIVPALSAAAARALSAQLRILPRRPAAERAALSRLATWAYGFSDQVSLAPPAALVLEAGRSLKLFGGAVALRRRVLDGVAGLGWQARCVLAPTPAAALVLAAAGEAAQLNVRAGTDANETAGAGAGIVADHAALRHRLALLPVAALDFTAAQLDDLQRMGIGRVGELLRLPRAGLAERLGSDRLQQLECLLGERPDPRRAHVPPTRFRATLELPAEVPDAPALAFACRRLIDELAAVLYARQAGVQHLHWRFHHADGPPTPLVLGSAAPARDPQHWLALLRERLDRLRLAAPVRAISVSSERLRPLAPADTELFPQDIGGATPDPALLDRLRARLGWTAVQGLAAVADHRPERAWRLGEPSLAPAGPRRGAPPAAGRGRAAREQPAQAQETVVPGAATGARRDRPLWLLAAPVALSLRDGRPWLDGPLDLGAGCERIDTGWWDDCPVARDYYAARTIAGERLWIYRELRGAGGWFLHGIFGDDPAAGDGD